MDDPIVEPLWASSSLFRTLCLGLLCLLAWALWIRRKLYYLSFKMSGPPALPLLGNVLDLGLLNDPKNLIKRIDKSMERYGEFIRLWFGPELCVTSKESAFIEEILLSEKATTKGSVYDTLAKSMGRGLLNSSGMRWKRCRHVLNPGFSEASIRSYQPIFEKYSKYFAESLLKVCNKGYVDVDIHCLRWASDITMESLYEHKSDFYKGKKDGIVTTLPMLSRQMHERACKFWLQPDIVYKITESGREHKKVLETYKNYFHGILKLKIDEYMAKDTNSNEDFEKGESRPSNPLKQMAVALQKNHMTWQEVEEEFNSIYGPGVDPISANMSSFILMMGMHKRCQDLVWNEIKRVFVDDIDAPVTWDVLPKLTYLDMCLKEVTRLFPTGPVQMRVADEDIALKSYGVTIPAGTSIIIVSHLVHRNPKYWESPNSFVPERFTSENSAKRPHFSYVPFSAGLRDCIGPLFAYNQLKTAAVHLIRKMEFHSDMKMENFEVAADISTRSAKGYHVVIKERDRNL